MIEHSEHDSDCGTHDLLLKQKASFVEHGAPDIKIRKANLKKLKAAVLAYREQLKSAVSDDFGHRSAHETDLLELFGIIQSIDYMIKNLKKFMKRERRHVGMYFQSGKAYVDYQPKGVVGIMSPWNYPLSLTLIPLATALAAGNRAMIKPSELTPKTSGLIKQLLARTFDETEVAVVLGDAKVGAQFSRQPFDHLLFTGSTPVGHKVMQAASEHLVPLTLELGGKSPAVIAKDHVNNRNIARLVFGKLANAGQTCVAPDYVFVHEQDLESFIKHYDEAVKHTYPKGTLSPDYTSIVNNDHYKRLNSLCEDARNLGVKVVEVGHFPERASERIRTIAPTLVIEPPNYANIMQEEIFGPLLPVKTYTHISEVIGFINSRARPLALYYFGDKNAECSALLANTTSGNVGINNTLMHVAQDDLPFGGIGPSGMGAYHGIEGFKAMSHAKGTYEQGKLSPVNLLRAPFGRIADFALNFTLGKSKHR
ncbi:coniferyl aldehyde dehydrogenase [Pseudoalteromonas ruthenica]|uniref:coniferyl aldehyde dehydrogenase n=1 Tax=Pseudoalteromonas ruthenica TaxID=151081 RepID=UPI00034DAD35|nr:coniferyl aldehyde dehydrogenase [Pseudoalteromonas ruthenica]